MKALITVLAVILGLQDAFAQQDPEYTHYMFNGLALNPAYAGSREALSAFALYRIQWVNLDEAPRTLSVSAHSPIGKTNNAVGLSIISDNLGVHNNIWINADYAYRIKLETGKLALGIRGQILNRSSDYSNVTVVNSLDPLFQPGQMISKATFDIGLGAYYSSKTFYLGASVPHLIGDELFISEANDVYNKQVRHLFVTAGAVVPISSQLKFKPSFLIKKAANSPMELDLNAMVLALDKIWFGLGYRTGDSFNFLLDIKATENFRVGYSYDLTVTKDFREYNAGSHEIILGYDFIPENTKVLTPRYF